MNIRPTPKGEWRLHKTELTQPSFFGTEISFWVIAKATTWGIQTWVFGFLALNSAWFASAGSFWHLIPN